MAEDRAFVWERGPGDPRVRYHYQRRAQQAINSRRAREARRILERIGRD